MSVIVEFTIENEELALGRALAGAGDVHIELEETVLADTSLDREEVEMIIVAVSGVNHCYYCNVAHGALVRI